ncbi:MAG: multiple sugar transport system permease protein, partial [Micromonosporaceae bacterium]|nr:multiple sugar transport system permease protein [Micromonosporaceae bacterium]
MGALLVVLLFVPPLLLLVTGSLHVPGLPPSPTPELIPDRISTEGYDRAIALGGLVRATLNSVLVSVFAVPLSVLVASLSGFALARLPGRITTPVVVVSLL